MVTIFYGEDSNKESLPCLASDEPAALFLTETKSEPGSAVEVDSSVNMQKRGGLLAVWSELYLQQEVMIIKRERAAIRCESGRTPYSKRGSKHADYRYVSV